MSSLWDRRIGSRPNRKPPHDRGSRRAVLADDAAEPERLSSYRGCPVARPSSHSSMFETNTLHGHAHHCRLRPGRSMRQHGIRRSRPSVKVVDAPCGSRTMLTRDASDRRLPFHVVVRVPAPRWFPMIVTGFRPCVTEGSPASRAAQFALAGRRNGRASDISVASPPLTAALARNRNGGSRRDRLKRAA